MRHAGRITTWNDDEGFGFLTPVDGGSRVFVHLKPFQTAACRPAAGDLSSYVASVDANGRVNAAAAIFGVSAQRKGKAIAIYIHAGMQVQLPSMNTPQTDNPAQVTSAPQTNSMPQANIAPQKSSTSQNCVACAKIRKPL